MFGEIVLIASYNELQSLKKIIPKIYKKYKLIIVNDGSKDKTLEYLKTLNVEVIDNKKNIGYEKSLLKGFDHVIKKYPKVNTIITFDADGEHKTSDLKRTLNFFKRKKINFLICNRLNIIRFSEKIISFLFYCRFKIKDPLSGFKIYNTNFLKYHLKDIRYKYFLVDLAKKICSLDKNVFNYPIKCKVLKNRSARVGNNFVTNIKILNILPLIIK